MSLVGNPNFISKGIFMFKFPDTYKYKDLGYGIAYIIPALQFTRSMAIFASNIDGWEHVSARSINKDKSCIPNWQEMCFIKDFFWDDDDVVIQYHPRKDNYINVHPHVLHLWRPSGVNLPCPPTHLV